MTVQNAVLMFFKGNVHYPNTKTFSFTQACVSKLGQYGRQKSFFMKDKKSIYKFIRPQDKKSKTAITRRFLKLKHKEYECLNNEIEDLGGVLSDEAQPLQKNIKMRVVL